HVDALVGEPDGRTIKARNAPRGNAAQLVGNPLKLPVLRPVAVEIEDAVLLEDHQEVPAGNTRDRLVVTDRNVNHVVNAGLRVVPVQLVKRPRIEEPVGLKLRASNPEPVVMLEDPLAASRSRRALLDKHEDLKLVPSLRHRIPSRNQM